MNLTPRLKQILFILLEEEQAIPVKELAIRIGVSKRTVQRELEYIDSSLKPYNISFESKTGVGVWLSGEAEDRQKLLEELQGNDDYDVSNREDRRRRLILEILKDKGLKKLFYYGSMFQVSETTISTDLEAIEGWLNEQQLTITRKPGSGIEVSGTEESYRRALRTFIDENIDTRMLQEAYEVRESAVRSLQMSYGNELGKVLEDDVLKRVVGCLGEINDQRILSMTENSYIGLVIHISIAMTRILKSEILEPNQEWQEELAEDADYMLASDIVARLEQEFDIEIPEIEVTYVCLHIKGAKHQGIEWKGQRTLEIERKELIELVNSMINAYDSENAFLLKQDNEFIQGLLAHLQPTFVRLRHDMKISNPMLDDIRKFYPEIYARSERAAAVLSEWLQKPVPETEVGFLTIHFGAAQVRMEGKKENIRLVHMGIVCASGIGISRLMLSKLDKIFREGIHMDAYGQNDVTPYIASKTDFFVSSIPLKNVDAEVLLVNPLLNEEDIDNIRQRIFHYQRMPVKVEEENSFTVELETVNILATQIKTILRYMDLFKVSNSITFGELVTAIAEKMSPYRDRQVMIQEDIEARERLGTQLFAEFGFALFHCRTKGVVRPEFRVCVTKDGAKFNDPYFKGISIVLVMLIPMDENLKINTDIFGYISSELIEDYDFLTTIAQGDKEEIRSSLSNLLRKYFQQYLSKMQ